MPSSASQLSMLIQTWRAGGGSGVARLSYVSLSHPLKLNLRGPLLQKQPWSFMKEIGPNWVKKSTIYIPKTAQTRSGSL